MDSEKTLMKFINSSIQHDTNDNGEKYNLEQARLVETFCYSIRDKIHPKIFETFIFENKIKYKPKKGPIIETRNPLNDLQSIHFKLLYNIIYIKTFYPEALSKFNLSDDLKELSKNEKKIISLYNKIRKINLN